MVEVTHTARRELILKHGLLQVADILEKYGIASVIDVSELKQDDFDALETLGLKPFVLMKIKRWSTEEWVRGFGRLIAVCNYPLSRFESRFAVNNRLLIT